VKKDTEFPPNNAQRVYRVADLPPFRGPTEFVIRNGDEDPRRVTLSRRKRQVIELLMRGPVYCASPVRLSDIVFILREEIGLDVETRMYPGDAETGAGAYGVYFLRSKVSAAPLMEAAA
jgi:hypothetical protein